MPRTVLLPAIVATLAVSLTPVTLTTPARAESKAETVHYCKYIASHLDLSVGDCVSAKSSDSEAYAAYICAAYREIGWLDDFGFENQGECIAVVKDEAD